MNDISRREALMNSQLASRADLLSAFDDAQLQAWANDLMGRKPFVCEIPRRKWIEGLLAASSIVQEMQRRRDVEALEAATG